MIFNKIRDIIIMHKSSIRKEKITLETRLKEDLGLDSFDAVELVIQLENTFKIKINDEAMQQFKTIRDIVDYIQ
ncbi:acyl carrier protein [Candidatus Phytoplasma phoenicium]|uniref:Acyl carrier protein n=1 Tax=Candidatus Phytoplasma phoenicium TaxID=198422 RepID=A0A0L0MJ76_9MOLU|nr:acyl carrier protein [Candidatus Phytoplasma phoenicium]KND62697.1 Acyl carrier protein [Candidatus Phytoplasma phoenicium]